MAFVLPVELQSSVETSNHLLTHAETISCKPEVTKVADIMKNPRSNIRERSLRSGKAAEKEAYSKF